MIERLTPEREAEMRENHAIVSHDVSRFGVTTPTMGRVQCEDVATLLGELDAVRAERDKLQKDLENCGSNLAKMNFITNRK